MSSDNPRHQWRNFTIISDQATICRQWALSLLTNEPALWIGASAPKGVEALPPGKVGELLGQDIAHLVFDAHDGFDADAFAIAAGLVRGGGRFLFLVPPLDEWPIESRSRFVRRLAAICVDYREPDSAPAPAEIEQKAFATAEQVRVVDLLWHAVHGHSKRPVVITADRGRGKSAAFGMAAAKLLEEGGKTLLVTAPRRNATLALFRHAGLALPDAGEHQGLLEYGNARLQFVAPDELVKNRPACDLLLVDEAAGIPLPLLEKLLRHYRRIAFATTVHGYEGSGRGFALRFSRLLDKLRPQWKRLSMAEPVRWAADDPLEKFTFQALLLDAEPAAIPVDARLDADRLVVEQVPRDELLQDESLLRHVFGLLISAHYRTTPTDLKHLMDAANLDLWVGRIDAHPVAAMLVATEDALPAEMHLQILQGKRRPADHLLPLAVATQCGFPDVLNLRCERVVRIAVHPALQRRGIGSRMLQELRASASSRHVDMLGSSFGATPELVRFWRRSGFTPVRLGFRREASSGAHSVLVLQGVSSPARKIQMGSRARFMDQFPLQLAEVFVDLQPSLVSVLMREEGEHAARLSKDDLASLQAFAVGGRQYLDCLGALYRLALQQLEAGAQDSAILVLKLLQKQPWQEVADVMGLAGKKAAQERLREHVAVFLSS
ncbi:tRNA(Met) cytidine acetyltransferase TmcA [Thiolapillus sp.]